MENNSVSISDREVFEYLLRAAVDDDDIKQQLTQILSEQNSHRSEMIEILLNHTQLQNAPAGLRKVFRYFQDKQFSAEVLQYLAKN